MPHTDADILSRIRQSRKKGLRFPHPLRTRARRAHPKRRYTGNTFLFRCISFLYDTLISTADLLNKKLLSAKNLFLSASAFGAATFISHHIVQTVTVLAEGLSSHNPDSKLGSGKYRPVFCHYREVLFEKLRDIPGQFSDLRSFGLYASLAI